MFLSFSTCLVAMKFFIYTITIHYHYLVQFAKAVLNCRLIDIKITFTCKIGQYRLYSVIRSFCTNYKGKAQQQPLCRSQIYETIYLPSFFFYYKKYARQMLQYQQRNQDLQCSYLFHYSMDMAAALVRFRE